MEKEISQRAKPRLETLWNANYIKVWLANFALNFSFMILTPLLPLYLNDAFGATKDQIGYVLSGYALTALLIRPFSGFFVDSFPRKAVLLIFYFVFAILFGGYIVAGSLIIFGIVRTLHGAPMGAATVANSTVAIDVLPSSRRAEGIGYYGISNNLSTAIAPAIGLYIYNETGNFYIIFYMALVAASIGFLINCTLKLQTRKLIKDKQPISLDRFILLKAWRGGTTMLTCAFAYGVLSTYLAIYGKEKLGITSGSGIFFVLLSAGLVMSRLIGARSLRNGKIVENATYGLLISLLGFILFASMHNPVGYFGSAFVIGLGNGHMFPAFQTMFINLAPNSQRGTANSTMLISWDLGVGMGIIVGGMIVEYFNQMFGCGYTVAFWTGAVANALGVSFYFTSVRKHYLANRLR